MPPEEEFETEPQEELPKWGVGRPKKERRGRHPHQGRDFLPRAANGGGTLDCLWWVVAAAEQHVDHLACGLGAADLVLQALPELVVDRRPLATLARLGEW